jgi:hypothetical protein
MQENRISRRLVTFGLVSTALGLASAPAFAVARVASLRRGSVQGVRHGAEVYVSHGGTAAIFRWDSRSLAADDGVLVIAPEGAEAGRWLRDVSGGLDVGLFGASPSASAAVNTSAFARASAAISRAGGGTLRIPPGTYRVGVQRWRRGVRSGGPHAADDIILIERCRGPVEIVGPGAILKAADGLHFGAFNPVTGARHERAMPFMDANYRVDAPVMVHVRHCAGPVRIEGLELDGNSGSYVLGGPWGDTGRQVSGDGIICDGNTGGVTISDVHSHDHGRDGIMLIHGGLAQNSPIFPVSLTNVWCDRNGRQGLSWVGGTQLTATRCRFTRTGRGRFSSAPAAGLDIEAEQSVCRNGRFVDCEFSDNVGVGMLADSGDSADMVFERCKFIGTTSWSAWPRKPGMRFVDCLFVGSIVQTFGDRNARRAAQFVGCRFHADPALSPTGRIYGSYLADLGGGATNVLMKNCSFRAIAPAVALPWSPVDTRYEDCTFHQAGRGMSYPKGVFTGTCSITSAGPVELSGSRFLGRVTLNGRVLT